MSKLLETSVASLIAAVSMSEQRAVARALQQVASALCAQAVRMGAQDADDVANAALEKIHAAVVRGDRPTHAGAWARRVLSNTIIDRARVEARNLARVEDEFDLERAPEESGVYVLPTPEEAYSQRELVRALEQCAARHAQNPQALAQILACYYLRFEQLTALEVAARMAARTGATVSEANVWKLAERGAALLREELAVA